MLNKAADHESRGQATVVHNNFEMVPKSKVLFSIGRSLPLSVTTYALSEPVQQYLEEILAIYLNELGHSPFKDNLAFCLRELTFNAQRACIKRIYFEEKGLLLDSEEDYAKGMENFREEVVDNIDYYLNEKKNRGLYVKVIYHAFRDHLKIGIRNNVAITRHEFQRVKNKIRHAHKHSSMSEAFSEVLDDTEGAGLGIIITVLMLRKLGLSERVLELTCSEGITTTHLTVPLSQSYLDKVESLSDEIVSHVDTSPVPSGRIEEIRTMLASPRPCLSAVSKRIGEDPSLTAQLLRCVNAPPFSPSPHLVSIPESLETLGLEKLDRVLSDAPLPLEDDPATLCALWDHSQRCAFYASYLAKHLPVNTVDADVAYVAGLLHDIGKVGISHLRPLFEQRIEDPSRGKGFPLTLQERFWKGYSHDTIGGKLAKKWHFPEILVEAIRLHHCPHRELSPEYQPLIFVVYLANILCNMEEGVITYNQISHEVLTYFGVSSHEKFSALQEEVQTLYQRQKNADDSPRLEQKTAPSSQERYSEGSKTSLMT